MIIGIDLGSRRTAIVAALPSIPVEVTASAVIAIDPGADRDPALLIPALDHLVACVRVAGARRVVVEHGRFYPQRDGTQQAIAATAQHHEVCAQLLALLVRELSRDGVAVVIMGRTTWAHRVVPRTKGGITDAMANDALPALLATGSWTRLGSQDERDAVGLILGDLLAPVPKVRVKAPPAEPRPRAPRKRGGLTPAQAAAASVRARERYAALTPEQKAALLRRAAERYREGEGARRAAEAEARAQARAAALAATIARGSWLR